MHRQSRLLHWGLTFCSVFLAQHLHPKRAIADTSPQTQSSDRSSSPASLQKTASWNWPDVSPFEEHLSSYLEQQSATPELRERVMEYWRSSSSVVRGPELIDRLLNAASIVEPRIEAVTAQLRSTTGVPVQPRDLEWLTSDVPGWLQDTIRLACGRALAQRRLVDEAVEAMSGLEISQVCDPSTLLFFRASCSHQLLKRDPCIADVRALLERESEIPVRYAQVAKLIQADIEPLESDSLDEISRLMFDVHRRLDLGRAGQRVRDQEQEIVDKLDKIIEQVEQQLQQQQQQAQQAAGQDSQSQSGQAQPMDETQVAGGPKGPGDVDKKETENKNNWGNLPPAERQESLQRLTEEFPSHYRDVIEGYFRQLAKDRQ